MGIQKKLPQMGWAEAASAVEWKEKKCLNYFVEVKLRGFGEEKNPLDDLGRC